MSVHAGSGYQPLPNIVPGSGGWDWTPLEIVPPAKLTAVTICERHPTFLNPCPVCEQLRRKDISLWTS